MWHVTIPYYVYYYGGRLSGGAFVLGGFCPGGDCPGGANVRDSWSRIGNASSGFHIHWSPALSYGRSRSAWPRSGSSSKQTQWGYVDEQHSHVARWSKLVVDSRILCETTFLYLNALNNFSVPNLRKIIAASNRFPSWIRQRITFSFNRPNFINSRIIIVFMCHA